LKLGEGLGLLLRGGSCKLLPEATNQARSLGAPERPGRAQFILRKHYWFYLDCIAVLYGNVSELESTLFLFRTSRSHRMTKTDLQSADRCQIRAMDEPDHTGNTKRKSSEYRSSISNDAQSPNHARAANQTSITAAGGESSAKKKRKVNHGQWHSVGVGADPGDANIRSQLVCTVGAQ